MNLIEVVDSMSKDMYERMKTAAETGRWPEGTLVDEATRHSALQITMAYQARHLDNNQMMTVGADGELIHKSKRELKAEFAKETEQNQQAQKQQNQGEDIVRFKDL
ncbi:YeaC family protein [Thalassotalea litorea]|uniref:YeaC family protein n=1 Tax=Thalassotalea litorea TaxID=2020715 RepID=UPI0037363184